MFNIKFVSVGILTSLIVASFSVSEVEAAKVYTWTDASGITHYSDKPFPQARNSKEIQVKAARPKGSDDVSGAESKRATAELFDAADTKRLNAECSKARKNLIALASGKTIQSTNAEGEQESLDEAAVQAEVQRNQSFINSYCQNNIVRSVESSNENSLGAESQNNVEEDE